MSSDGKGRRAYTTQRNCIRGKLLRFFADNPTAMVTRQEICDRFSVTIHSLEYAVTILRRDGHIKSLYGPNQTAYYLRGDSPIDKLPKPPTVQKAPKTVRRWPEGSSYVAPQPIAISVFEWRP